LNVGWPAAVLCCFFPTNYAKKSDLHPSDLSFSHYHTSTLQDPSTFVNELQANTVAFAPALPEPLYFFDEVLSFFTEVPELLLVALVFLSPAL
jgi:hypothetical protein